ncbi:MAG: hypothetical protein RLZZ200_2194 [Pseudomonadota bacterium]|jgi:uncharacterized protein YyaL (SSP411 family)
MLASPFHRSHAGGLVAWREWNAAAIAAARASGHPLFMHIGCEGSAGADAMRRGAFADPATAQLLNRDFVCVLVDRDLQPELDRLMQLAHRLLTREDGSWPLNLFLSADEALPFFGGGYFPVESAAGTPGLRAVLERVSMYHATQRPALHEQGKALREALGHVDAGTADANALPSAHVFAAARRELEAGFDREQGGWGRAPKFPQVLAIQHLMRTWQASAPGEQPDLQALYMATFTLTRIADGALHDPHGGFFRYCLDAAWREPLPEKAQADNAQLLEAFAEAALLTGERRFREVADRTADFLLAWHAEPDDTAGIVPQVQTARSLAVAARALGRDDLQGTAHHWLERLQQREPDGLEEHAALLDAMLAAAMPGERPSAQARALQLADAMLELFEDRARGGFFAARADAPLIHRLREFADHGQASGNALAAQALLRLDALDPTPRYRLAALRCLRAAALRLQAQPLGHLGLLAALSLSDI